MNDAQQMWNERFGSAEYVYGFEPNDFLREQAMTLPRGKVLSLAEGEGRNAVWLATQGFDVWSVDSSSAGVAKTLKLAESHGITVHATVGDLADYFIERTTWDVIVSIFAHTPPPIRRRIHQQVVKGLRHGGVYLLEAYTPAQIALGAGGSRVLYTLVKPRWFKSLPESYSLVPKMKRQSYLDAINERVIVFDGAFGTYIQDLNLSADDFGGPSLEGCNEMLCITKPDVIRSMHEAFLAVGVDALETASFGSFSTVLNEYDIPERTFELNVAAASLAREVAHGFEADGRTRFVAGSIGPGTKLPSLGHIRFGALRDAYAEQAQGLLRGGADLFIIETCMDLLQIKAAMQACRRAMHSE